MPRKSEYVDYLVEMLQLLGEVRARAMFGGWGFYLDDRMFAIVADEEFFVKVDAVSRAEFDARGLEPFRYEARGKTYAMSYYRPPPETVDDREVLCVWARKGIEAAKRAAKSTARGSKKSAKPRRG
jgi:DNA transformation protein